MGADVEYKSNNGRTPLWWAAEKGREAVVKLPLEKRADVESKDRYYGHTPLSWAARGVHEAVVKLLLEKGAENFGTSTNTQFKALTKHRGRSLRARRSYE